jgi:protein-disulfide isomerase
MSIVRRLAIASALPLALTIAACGGSGDSTTLPKAEAIAPIPPPAGKVWSDVVAATPEGGMRMGNPNAPIKLIEYGSLTCPHCARFAQEGLPTLRDKYVNSGRVSYEFRSFLIHGVIDLPLTVMVRCASPDAFFGIVEQIYSDQENLLNRAGQAGAQAEAAQNLPPNQRYVALGDAFGLTEWFAARGVSVDQSHACLADTAALEKAASETKTASDNGINSTPTLIVNGNVTGFASWKELEPALQNAGAR